MADDIEIDLGKLISFFKENKQVLLYVALALILVWGFHSRTRNIPNMEGEYLVSPDDPYYFLRYSNIIAEEGQLPEVDTLRYYPDGFQAKRENNFMNYLAGYSLRFVRIFNPNADMYSIAYFLPPILFVLGLAFFFLFVDEVFDDKKISLIATGFLAFSPAILFRTLAGFLEKEPLFFPLMFATFYFFTKAYKIKNDNKKLYLFAATAGILTGLAAFSSGLFIFIMMFISIFLVFEVLLDRIDKNKFSIYLIWTILAIITTSLLTLKYGGITGFYKATQFQMPIAALVFGLVSVSFKEFKPLKKIHKKFKKIPNGIFYSIIAIILISIGAIILFGTAGFTEKIGSYTTQLMVPGGKSAFHQSVSENQPPTFVGGGRSWWSTFGTTFVIARTPITIGFFVIMFSIGAIILFDKIFKKYKYSKYLTATFILLSAALLFENYSGDPTHWINAIFSFQWIYFGIFGITFLIFLYANKEKTFEKINSLHLFVIVAYILAIIASNGAVRVFFIMAIPAAIISAYFIIWCEKILKEKFENKNYEFIPIILAFALIIFMCFSISGSVARMSPNLGVWYESMDWIKENTGEDAIMTSWWDYGYLIHEKAERATVGDPGNFDVQRNYDIGGHVFNAYNNSEILWFADKYELTDKEVYLIIPSEDILKFVQIARLGSQNEKTAGREMYFSVYGMYSQERNIVPNQLRDYEEFTHMIVMEPFTGPSQVLEDFRIGNRVYGGESTYITNYVQPISENNQGPLLVQIYDGRTGRQETLPVNCICSKEHGCVDVREDGVPTCVLIFQGGIVNIPNKARDILFTQLFLLDRHEEIEGFEKVYDNNLPLNINTARGGGPLIRIYQYNWEALQNQEGW